MRCPNVRVESSSVYKIQSVLQPLVNKARLIWLLARLKTFGDDVLVRGTVTG